MIVASIESTGDLTALLRTKLRAGARFAWLFGDTVGDATLLRCTLAGGGAFEHYAAAVTGPVESLAREFPGAAWHERDAREMYGIEFTGGNEIRRRNRASEVSTILYGPVRSGIVESACWAIDTAGEDFLHVEPSMSYKRRDLEQRCAAADIETMPLVAEHVSGATAVSHATALSIACEEALGVTISANAAAARAALLELERIHQHLDALAKLAEDGSLSVGSSQMFVVKERMHRFLAQVTGSRFARATVCVGGVRFDVLARLRDAVRAELASIEAQARETLALYFSTPSLTDRLVRTGMLSPGLIREYAAVGPVARGSGVPCDVRGHDEVLETGCDALARAWVRKNEIEQSFALVRSYVAGDAAGPFRVDVPMRSGTGFCALESPQGELLYFVRFEPGATRVALRSASYQNWPVFVPSLQGNIFTDFSFIEHSFGLVQSEVDR